MNPYLQDVELLVARKNESYGNSIGKSASLLGILCPAGINPNIYHRIHIVIRLLDKVSRLVSATLRKEEALDAWTDIAGYAIKARQLEEDYFEHQREDG